MDLTLFYAINGLSHASPLFDAIGVFFAQFFPFLVGISFLIFIFLESRWKFKFYYASLATLAIILSEDIILQTIRFFYNRHRPPLTLNIDPLIALPQGASFPSGHATFFFALGMAVFFVNRKWGMWFLISACLIGIARVFAGVHWPSDILGGALLGIVSTLIIKHVIPAPISNNTEEKI